MLLQEFNNNFLTLDEIASELSLNKSSVTRKSGIEDYFVENRVIGRGRPVALYRKEVLQLWKGVNYEIESKVDKGEDNRKPRSDRHKPRLPRGASDEFKIELDKQIKEWTFDAYMAQPRPKMDLKKCVENAVRYYIQTHGAPEGFGTKHQNPAEHMVNYYYFKRIKNPGNNSYFCGWAEEESWEQKATYKWQKHEHNNRTVNNSWEYIELFVNLGLLGKGFGGGDLWFVDGTGFDAWVELRGKKQLINFMVVFDALTGYPLHFVPVRSESSETVIRLIAETYSMYGAPRYGFVLDNSSAFKSNAVKGFIQGLYSDDYLKSFEKSGHWSKKIFGKQERTMCWMPMGFIPQFPFKAAGERKLQNLKKYMSRELADTWQADQTHKASYELGSQAALMRNARKAETVWKGFYNWIYTEYVNELNYKALKHYSILAKQNGLSESEAAPTPANAFDFFRNPERLEAPSSKKPIIYYWCTPNERTSIHRVTVRNYGSVSGVQHENVQRNYICENLDDRYYNKKVAVVPVRDNPKQAYIYLEYNKKVKQKETPEKGDVHFIGLAYDGTVRTEADLDKTYNIRRIREKIDTKLEVKTGDPVKPQSPEPRYPKLDKPIQNLPEEVYIPEPADDIHENAGFNYEIDNDEDLLSI